jgi:hypothetical protein
VTETSNWLSKSCRVWQRDGGRNYKKERWNFGGCSKSNSGDSFIGVDPCHNLTNCTLWIYAVYDSTIRPQKI